MFRRSILWIVTAFTLAIPWWAQQVNYVPIATKTYAPPEVGVNAHPAHQLTVLHPKICPPGRLWRQAGGGDLGSHFLTLPFELPEPDGVVRLTLGTASPACLTFSTQAIVADVQHAMPFALTNAVDITVQP